MTVNLTRLSAKGQLVIPSMIRRKMNLQEGTPFAVISKGDTILLKKVKMPTMADFDRLVAKGEKTMAKQGIRQEDVEGLVHKFRGVKA